MARVSQSRFLRSYPNLEFLRSYPNLGAVVQQLNEYLEDKHPTIFGKNPTHPVLPVRRSKVVHDNLWGTVRFSWRELAIVDSPVMQRLRDIHQTGLASYVYPSAQHTRFEHSLGAATIASRIFDALSHRQRSEIRDIARIVDPDARNDDFFLRIKQELRLAALLHDAGHCLFSHTSEKVYEKLDVLLRAADELTRFVGKQKGAGEVLSFCIALTPALSQLLERASKKLIGDSASDDYDGSVDLVNVALIIVGRSKHPYLQFLGDIVSSGFDADKLDYLLRDARAAGLPLTYDVDRYLYDIRVQKEVLADGQKQLKQLYDAVGTSVKLKPPNGPKLQYPHFDTYRLRLSRRAMNVIEQIMICKMMLFSYIYHHGKVRASEGLLERLLDRKLELWRKQKIGDEKILEYFLEMTDASLRKAGELSQRDEIVDNYTYRLTNRLVPREIYSISGPSATHAAGEIIRDFLLSLHDKENRTQIIRSLEDAIGAELVRLSPELGRTGAQARARAGIWVDAPKAPKFEDIDEMVTDARSSSSGVPLAQIFPIREWTQAYEHYRYQVRIYSFSEYYDVALRAAKAAMQSVLKINSDSFYEGVRRVRS